jgi:hypothetical protein
VAVTRGWVSITTTLAADPSCVFCGWLDASHGDMRGDAGPLTPTVVGAVAALVASSVIDWQLGFARARHPKWLRYDAETSTLEERAIAPREDCPLCAGAWKNACHPTLAS